MARINKRTVNAVRPEQGRDVVLWDESLPGFGLRVKPSGATSYIVQYRNAYGRSRRMTIGRHGVSKAQLELRRAHAQRRRLEQTIILQVRKAARDLESAQEGIEASEREVNAATEQLEAEQIRFEEGVSTPFQVLLKEEDLVEAEARKIAAFQTYRSSVTNLDRFQGTILRNRNISIDQASRLR